MHGMGLLYKPITLHNNEGLFGEVASAFAVRTVPGRRPRVRAQAAGLAPGRVWWHRWQGHQVSGGVSCRAGGRRGHQPGPGGRQAWYRALWRRAGVGCSYSQTRDEGGGYGSGVAQQDRAARRQAQASDEVSTARYTGLRTCRYSPRTHQLPGGCRWRRGSPALDRELRERGEERRGAPGGQRRAGDQRRRRMGGVGHGDKAGTTVESEPGGARAHASRIRTVTTRPAVPCSRSR